MTPVAWGFLGWAVFASFVALVLLGHLFGERAKIHEAHQQQLSETYERGLLTGKLEEIPAE